VQLPTDDIAALVQRVWGSFLGRCVQRFLAMAGFARGIVLASQAFTALIPLLILTSTLAPAGQEDVVAQTVITKFGLTGSSADSVEQLFQVPEGATSTISVFSALLLLFSGLSFARRMQTMYRQAWGREKQGVRSGLFAALGLVTMLAEVLVLYALRGLFRNLPLAWLLTFPLAAATGLLLWTSIPYLLLNREVHWRRLLAVGGVSAIGTSLYGVASTIYMPSTIQRYTNEFGLFGITIALIGWLLAVSAVLVGGAAIGAVFDESRAPWVIAL
jgi:uncharacterized BrkB/YihY/UPF0761 family membrane protein